MEIKTLEGIDTKDILDAFNACFSNYYITLQFTHEQLVSKIFENNVKLELSVGVFRENKLVAFILNGLGLKHENKAVYNAGTGVLPKDRNQGLSKKMHDFILPLLLEQGFEFSILEVISENEAALKTYEKFGYQPVRDLFCYFGKPTFSDPNPDIEIKKLESFDWDLMQSFWDIKPTWQNSVHSINRVYANLVSLGAFLDHQLVGYIIYNPENGRLKQIAIQQNSRRKGIATCLLLKALENNKPTLSVINVDEKGDSLINFLEKIGLAKELVQMEMSLKLMAGSTNE